MTQMTRDARFWDRTARKYAQDPIADLAGYERTLEATAQRLQPDHRVLELGCGTGSTALRLAPGVSHYLATDISGEMIAIAREKAEAAGLKTLSFEVASPEAAPWPDAHYDIVLAFNLLHLLADRRAALRSVHRVLKPGGLFISKTPCLKEMSPWLRAALVVLPLMQALGKAPQVTALNAADLEADLTAAGFEILERARHSSGARDFRPYVVAVRG